MWYYCKVREEENVESVLAIDKNLPVIGCVESMRSQCQLQCGRWHSGHLPKPSVSLIYVIDFCPDPEYPNQSSPSGQRGLGYNGPYTTLQRSCKIAEEYHKNEKYREEHSKNGCKIGSEIPTPRAMEGDPTLSTVGSQLGEGMVVGGGLLRQVAHGVKLPTEEFELELGVLKPVVICLALPVLPTLAPIQHYIYSRPPERAGRGISPKFTASTGGSVPLAAEHPSSQLPGTTSIPPFADPLSMEESNQQTSLEHSRRNSLQLTAFEDASTHNIQQPIQPERERGESVQLHNDPPIELQEQATMRPLDLLALATPVVPEELQRYNRKVDGNETHYIEEIQPQKLDYTGPQVPGWDRIVHPDGAPYFFADRSMPVYTDTDLSIPQHCTYVEDFIPVLINAVTHPDVPGHSLTLVLKLICEDVPTRREQQCFYYFIDHSKRLIFWVHPVKLMDICGTARGARSEGHLRYAIETHYWFVCSAFIHAKKIMAPPSLTADESKLVDIGQPQLPPIARNVDTCKRCSHRYICSNHFGKNDASVLFLNLHGQYGVRLGRGRAVFPSNTVDKEPGQPIPILSQASTFIFGSFTTYIRDIQKIWVDGVVDESRWKAYISKLRSDWDSYTLYSTVMLAASFSLFTPAGENYQLPIGTTVPSNTSRYLIYVSIIASVSTIIVSVNLTNQIRKFDVDSVFGAEDYMASMASDKLGVRRLATMFMLPPVFLQLSLWSFVAAFAATVFEEPIFYRLCHLYGVTTVNHQAPSLSLEVEDVTDT
ncbi:hypothetical protein BU15DRAFT_64539 [Melanogaster broomeanus]|nr:hypothetical protein BU15DRAFT_64539 [Melanogaster broomeanus]